MKICFFGDSESIHIIRWCKHFASLGHEIHLLSFKKTEIDGIKHHHIDAGDINVGGGNWKVLFQSRKIKKMLKIIQPDILHSFYATSYGIAGALSGFHPYVVSALGSDILVSPRKSFLYRKMLRLVFKKADWITVMAQHMKAATVEMKLGGENKMTVLPFGINTKLFNDNNRKISNEKFVITSTRNFEDVYNIPHLIKSIAILKDKIPNLQLNMIGDGTKRKEIEKLIRSNGLENSTEFFGKLSQDKIADVLNKSHVFVSVSLSDGNNISLNEAMACGAYCIATDIPANQQWIHDGVNGRLVKINDVNSLSEIILELYKNYEKYSSGALIENKKIIAGKCDWAVNMKTVENKYIELCKKK